MVGMRAASPRGSSALRSWASAPPPLPTSPTGRSAGRALSGGRHDRHPGAPHGRLPGGAARPAVRDREQAGRRQQHRDRSGGRTRRRTATRILLRLGQRDQRHALQASSPSTSCATSRRSPASCARAERAGGASVGAGEDRAGVHRLRQGQSRQGQHGLVRHRHDRRISPASCSRLMTGVECVHVPYRGSAPAVTDLFGGQVQVGSTTCRPSLPHINGGQLRALAVTTATRSPSLPDVPTDRRLRAGLRGERLVRLRRAQGHAAPRSSTSSTARSTPGSPTDGQGAARRARRRRRCS